MGINISFVELNIMKYIIKKLISKLITNSIKRKTKLSREQSTAIAECFLSVLYNKKSLSFRQFKFWFNLLFNETNWKEVIISEDWFRNKFLFTGQLEEYHEPIGCWFTIDADNNYVNKPLINNTKNIIFYSSGRECLLAIANMKQYKNKTVLLPAFTCETVCQPFAENGWKIIFYKIDLSLKIDRNHIETLCTKYEPSVAVFMEYCGMDLSSEDLNIISNIKQSGCLTIVDTTLNIYSTKRHQDVDFYYGSIRKWIPCPDGAYLEKNSTTSLPIAPKNTENNEVLTTTCTIAMYANGLALKWRCKRFHSIAYYFRQLSLLYLDTQPVLERNMSNYSRAIFYQEQKNRLKYIESRIMNCKYIFNRIRSYKTMEPAFTDISRITCAPLYFHIYAKEKNSLVRYLEKNGIQTWSYHMPQRLDAPDEQIRYIYEHTIFLPCDQRYNEIDMKLMCDVLEKYEKKYKDII